MPDWLQTLWNRLLESASSLHRNTLVDLAAFLVVLGLWFFGALALRRRRLCRGRARLRLSIGGWGTRGKSGTERKKAALFHALGYEVVVKTSGCEAMVIHAIPTLPATELYLYRANEKATIWEQADVVDLAQGLKPHVFLWECMALNPRYVRILSHHWMHDPITTLTNGFPDHEDIQGPAGIDVANTIASFIPPGSRTTTAEEQMFPAFRAAARAVGTPLVQTDYRRMNFIPEEILARFPYTVHPYNLALVHAMVCEFGIAEGVAYKEVADAILPDIGVLKVFPTVDVNGARLQFANGMSANERTGFLGNWRRLGYATETPEAAPETRLALVVNNRADRVPRSQVFAAIIAADTAVDDIFVIGTATNAFRGFAETELDRWLNAWEPTDPSFASPEQAARMLFGRLRLGYGPEVVALRLAAMLQATARPGEPLPEPIPMDGAALMATSAAQALSDDARTWLAAELDANAQANALIAAVAAGTPRAAQDARAFFKRRFFARMFIHEGHTAPAARTLRLITQATPPGLFTRLLGVQNIKGPGLGFVYAWATADRVCQMLDELERTDDELRVLEILEYLRSARLGTLGVGAARPRLARLAELPKLQLPRAKEMVQDCQAHFAEELAKDEAEGAGSAEEHRGVWTRVLEVAARTVEPFLEVGDSIRRKRRARQIFRALANGLIAHETAAAKLRALVTRQKGGWVQETLRHRLRR